MKEIERGKRRGQAGGILDCVNDIVVELAQNCRLHRLGHKRAARAPAPRQQRQYAQCGSREYGDFQQGVCAAEISHNGADNVFCIHLMRVFQVPMCDAVPLGPILQGDERKDKYGKSYYD